MSATDSLGTAERQAISQQLVQLVDEIGDIAAQTEFNGVALLSNTTTFKFQTAPNDQTTWTTSAFDAASLGMSSLATLTATDVIDTDNYQPYYNEVEAALNTVNEGLTILGSLTNRLTAKESMISVARNNTEAAYNRIFNADMASEQIEVTKNQILQQTSFGMLAQANMNSQSVLALFQ